MAFSIVAAYSACGVELSGSGVVQSFSSHNTHTGLASTLLLHNAKKVAKKCNFGGNGISNTQFLVPLQRTAVLLYAILLYM